MSELNNVTKVKHWGRTFMVGDHVFSERHMALGIIHRIYMNQLDRDHYAEVKYERALSGGHLRVSDPLSWLRHATEVEIAVHEAKKALDL